jgi:membrane protein implicated in regulation of membrane protease activity
MTFNPAIWYPIAILLSVANVVAIGFTAGPGQPWHAVGHAALALAFASWARRLRKRRGGSEQLPGERGETLEALETDVSRLRQEVSEMQERLDFAERLLAQRPEARPVEPRP